MMKMFHAELMRYLLAGVANTAIGYLAFLIALHGFSFSASWANAISYTIGLACAYVLNALFVFKAERFHLSSAIRFAASFILAFTLNLMMLNILLEWAKLMPELAQIFAMIAYTITFYLLNKLFVFKDSAFAST